MTPKKVLFVIPYLTEGGAQRALSGLESNLPDDWEIDTLINSEIGKKFPVKGRLLSLHIDTKPRTSSVVFQFIAFVKRVRELKRLKRTNDYDACISFIDSANIANIISGHKSSGSNQTKIIISVRNSIVEASKKRVQYKFFVRPLARMLYNKADTIVAVSQELREELGKEFRIDKDKVISITNGFDLEYISKRAKESIPLKIDSQIRGRKIVLTVGRLVEQKNQWHLIRAFSTVKKNMPDAILLIAGTGALDNYLKELTSSLELENDVVFLNFEENVYKYMSRASVFVLPSAYEGFPNVLGEALCSGAPCVATDFHTGAREILAPDLLYDTNPINEVKECEYGILTPACSGKKYTGNEPLEPEEEMLADAIIRILEPGKASFYREKSGSRCKDLDIRNTVNMWINLIEG